MELLRNLIVTPVASHTNWLIKHLWILSKSLNHIRRQLPARIPAYENIRWTKRCWKFNRRASGLFLFLPRGDKNISTIFFHQVKWKSNESVERYKSILVVNWFSQNPVKDFGVVYDAVIKHTMLRLFLAIIFQRKLKVLKVSAWYYFLNGPLNEKIYVGQPEYFVKTGMGNKFWRLQKALYGHVQAANSWKYFMIKIFNVLGFIRSSSDKSLFVRDNFNDDLNRSVS